MDKYFMNIKEHNKYKFVMFGILIFGILILFFNIPSKKMSIEILDVGQGDGICIKTPEGKVITMDGGSSDIDDVGKYRIVPFLKYKGISVIDYAFISHMDTDHMNGIRYLLENATGIRVKNVVLPYIDKASDAYKEFVKIVMNKNIRLVYMKSKDVIRLGAITIKCLHPDIDYTYNSENGYSLVVLLSYKKFDMLFTGDVEADGEEIIKDKWNETDIEVLKVSHHGSKNSSTREFLKRIKAKYAIISAGKDNTYGHPHKETIERLKKCNINIYTTVDKGAISIKTDGEQFRVM